MARNGQDICRAFDKTVQDCCRTVGKKWTGHLEDRWQDMTRTFAGHLQDVARKFAGQLTRPGQDICRTAGKTAVIGLVR